MDHDDDPAADPREPGHEQVGSLADEATRLLGAFNDWARDHEAVADAPGPADHELTGDCTWCPVCRVVHAVRQTNPEVRDQLLVAATSLMQAGAGMLAALQASAAERGAPASRPAPHGRPAPGGRVERIDLDDTSDVEGPDERPEEA